MGRRTPPPKGGHRPGKLTPGRPRALPKGCSRDARVLVVARGSVPGADPPLAVQFFPGPLLFEGSGLVRRHGVAGAIIAGRCQGGRHAWTSVRRVSCRWRRRERSRASPGVHRTVKSDVPLADEGDVPAGGAPVGKDAAACASTRATVGPARCRGSAHNNGRPDSTGRGTNRKEGSDQAASGTRDARAISAVHGCQKEQVRRTRDATRKSSAAERRAKSLPAMQPMTSAELSRSTPDRNR